MALTEFLRRLVPRFTRDHRIRRGIGSTRRSQRGPTAPHLESLEDRTLLAAVAWDGDAGDLQWTNPLNWDGDVLPGASDDVTIDIFGSEITVELAGSASIQALNSQESVHIVGGSLTVTATSSVSGTFSMDSFASLTAEGAGASFVASSTTVIEGANLNAVAGATLSLPNLSSYDVGTSALTTTWNLRADGPGSTLNLPALETIVGPDDQSRYMKVEAIAGGTVNLPSLTQISVPVGSNALPRGVAVISDGASSLVTMPALTAFIDGGRTSNSSVQVRNSGSIQANNLTTTVGVSLYAADGLTLSLPSLATYDTGTSDFTKTWSVQASGAGSILDLPALTTMTGPENQTMYLNVEALAGGTVNLPALSAIDVPLGRNALPRGVAVISDGASSLVTMPALTAFIDGGRTSNSSVQVRNSGSIQANNLTTTVGVSLYAADGLTLSLPSLATYDTGTSDFTKTWIVQASGAGSILDLPALTTMTGPENQTMYLNVEALAGGTVNLPALSAINVPLGRNALPRGVAVISDGASSLITMPALTAFIDGGRTSNSSVQVRNSGSIQANNLTTTVGVSLYAADGLTLSLPSLATYDTGTSDFTKTWIVQASGAGSILDLPALTTMTGPENQTMYLNVEALAGGTVNLPALSAINVPLGRNALPRGVAVISDGASSLITMPALTTFIDGGRTSNSSVQVRNSGSIQADDLTTTAGVSLYAADGLTLSLPSLATYDIGTSDFTKTWSVQASGAGSIVDLPVLTNITGPEQHTTYLNIEALAGGTVNLPVLTQIAVPAGINAQPRGVAVIADGADSLISLPTLTDFIDGGLTSGSSIEIRNGGSVLANNLTTAVGVSLFTSDGLTLSLPSLATYDPGTSLWTKTWHLRATGAGSTLDLPGLTTITGPEQHTTYLNIEALAGGTVNLPVLTQIAVPAGINAQPRGVAVIADGADSLISLPTLTDFIDGGLTSGSSIEIRHGGSILANNLTTAVGVSLFTSDGLTLSLPSLATYDPGTSLWTKTWHLRATGAGSTLDLPGLTTITGPEQHTTYLNIEALAGGTVNLPVLTQIAVPAGINAQPRGVAVIADGADSLISLPTLTDFIDGGLTSGSSIEIRNGGSVVANNLTTAVGVSLFTSDGLTLSLPSLATYDPGTSLWTKTWTFRATGVGSTLDLPNLTTIMGPEQHTTYLNIEALAGGTVNLPALTHITVPAGINPQPRGVAVLADGTGSVVSMPALTDFIDGSVAPGSRLEARMNGRVDMSATSSTASHIDVIAGADGEIGVGTLTVATGSTLSGTGVVAGTVINDGDVSPGASTGALSISGDYVQATGGQLHLEVGGLLPGTEHDQLNVTGTVTLAGTLNVSLINSFSPADGNTFEVLTFGARNGDFNTKNGLDLPGNQVLSTNYGAGNMVLGAIGDDPPVIASLSATPNPVLQSADLTLTADGVTDPNVNVAAVRFYRDVDGNGLLDPGIDELVGSDSDASDGWSVTAPAVLAVGTHTLLSQVEDTTNNFSNVVATTVDVTPSVYWDGGAGDFQWNNRLNWSDDVLPGATSDVVINVPGDITVAHNGLVTTVRSLTSEESVLINGGSLKVTQSSVVKGDFSVAANSTFTVDGLTASLTAPNTTSLGLGNLFAQNGGVLNLSAVTYAQNGFDGQTIWRATGAGSQIDLSGLTALAGYGRNGQLIIDAIDGAEVDLSNVINNTYGTTQITARGTGSVIDHSSMTSWRDANRQRSSFVRWESGGVVRLDVLQSMDSVGIIANSGETLSIPSLTNISGIGDSTATFLADGVGSRIELPAVTTMDGSDRHGQIDLRARNGGVIDLPLLTTLTSGTTTMSAFDADSVINISALESWTDNNRQRNSFLSWGDGGTVVVDSLQTLNSVSVTANNGNVLTFPVLERIGGVGDSTGIYLADGAGSRLEFPSVVFMDGPERHGDTSVQARNGGVINLPVLSAVQHGAVNISAFDTDGLGNGSFVNTPSLVSWNNNNDHRDSWLRYGRGGDVDLSVLTTLIGVSIYSEDGGTVRLPALLSYERGGNTQSRIMANGAHSRIELPIASSIWGNTNRGGASFWAFDGGIISMPQVATISGGPTHVIVRGAGSTLEIDALETWTIGGTQWFPSLFRAEDGGLATTNQNLNISYIPVEVENGGTITANMLELGINASLTGDGTILGDLVNTRGTVRPGNSLGGLTVNGNFENTVNGTVQIDLGGTQPAIDHDLLTVTGQATLDGTLTVNLVNGFAPVTGDTFEILQFDSRVCDFLTKNGLDLGGGLHLAAAFDLTSMTLNTGTTPDSGQQCQTIPVLTNVDVGPDPAKIGDDLSVTFEVDVALLNTPDVTVAGNAATFAAQNGSLYTFTYTVAGTEPEGFVDVVMTATSLDGGVGTETVSTELDFTDPVITNISASQVPADVGTPLTIAFNSSEPLSDSTEVLIGGQPATRNNSTSYTRLLTGDEGLGEVTVEVAAVDLAGNTSSTTEQVLIVSGGFDVNVTGIDLSDDRPAVGQTVTATSQIHNSGLYDVSNVPVRLTLIEPDGDEILLSETVVPLIAAGSSAVVATNIDLATGGVHVFRLQVDPDNLIPEIRELDNVATRSLIVDSAESTVIDVSGSLSLTSVVPGADVTVSGSASWLAGLNPAGAVAGGLVSLNVPGTFISGTAFTDSNGAFALLFDAPVVPGDYVANVTVSDVTTQSLLALPFTVTAPVGGIDFFTNDARIGASDVTPVINTSVTLSARVHNVGGDDFTSATNVRFYDGGTLISTQSITGLVSQASTVVSFSHTFTSAGPHVITAVVDEDNLTVENNESNNAGSRTITVLDNVPDLSPIDILFSDLTPATTDTVTITARVLNDGGAGATDVVVRFFDGTNALGAAVIPAVAADGGIEFVSIQAVLPPAGQHDISVVVDPEGAIAETDETNNLRIESILVHDPAPDLVAAVIGLSDPTPVAGDTIDVSMTISNQGELAAGAFDAAFLKDGTSFGTVRVPGLAAGSTTVVSLSTSFSTVGGHSVSIVLDAAQELAELSESNNTSSRGLQVLATPLSDLSINGSDIVLSDPNPATGDTVTVTVPIRNIGQANATGVAAELRIDGVVVGSAASSPSDIPIGQSAAWTFDFVAPAGDGFHLLEIVIDQDNLIGESNENNNRDFLQFLVGDHPDLVPSGVTFSNVGPVEGDVITISATVTNDGDAAAGEFLVRVLDGSQPIGEVTVAGLAIGGSEVINVPFDTTGRTGLRLIQVIADPGNLITEFNEGDNLISRNLPVASADAVAPTTVAAASVAANAAGWNNTDVDVVLTAADNPGGSGVAYLRYSVDGGPLQTTLGDTQTIAFSAEGIHNIAWQAVDFAQNTETLQTLTVRIDKTAPVAVHGGAYSLDEGDSITLDGTGSADALSGIADIQWALDGDGLYNDGATPEYVAPDGPLNVPVQLRVLDAAGNEAIVATEIVVANVAPTAHAGGNVNVAEGGTRMLDASGSSDPGDDIVSYQWDLDGDGVFGETGVDAAFGDELGSSPTFDASLLDGPDSRAVTLRVTDSFGAVGADTVTITVTNVAPTFEAGPNGNLVPAEDGVFSRTNISFTDPGLADVHTVTVNFGDSTGDQIFTLATGTRTFDLGHTYVAEGQFTVSVSVSDDDGGVATDSFLMDVVLNTAPEAAIDSHSATNEVAEAAATGTLVGVTASSFDADGDTLVYSLDDTAGGRFRIDASSGIVSVDDGTLLDGPDSHTITVRATDPFAEYSTADFTIAVLNVDPTVAADLAQVTVDEGSTATNSGVFGDIGADTVAVTASVGTVTQNDTAGTWSWSFDTDDGPDDSQSVIITATDSDGAESTTTFDLTVNNVAPTVSVGDVPSHAVQWKISDGGNDHWYWLSDAQNTWYDAENEAVAAGGHLAAIASAAENAFLTTTFLSGGQRFWMGFTDADDQGTTEGNFVWSSGEPVTYTNWSAGEPNNQVNEDWGLLQSGGLWNDGRFNYATRERGIIEFSAGGGTGLSEVVVSEGQTATNVGVWSDPGLDLVTLTASIGFVTKNSDGTWSWSFDTSDGPNDSETVTITARDSDNAVSTTAFELTVENVAPTVGADHASVTVGEGSTAGNSGVFGDVGADTVTITASIGTITQDDVAGTWSWSFDTTDGPDETQTVTITATDSDGAATATTFGLTVTNEAPTVAADNATITVAEGSTASNSGVFGDVGADTVAVTASIGTVVQNNVAGTWSWSWDTSDGPEDSQIVTITATDSDGAATATTFGLTVTNEAPTVAADNATITVAEGSTAGNSGVFGDVGADTVAVTASIGTVVQNDVAGTWSWSWDTTDGPDDSQTVTITATDSDGVVSTTTFGLTVSNEAPTVAADNATITVSEGSTASNSGTFGDVGADTVAIATSVGTVTQNDVTGTWSWSYDTNDGPDNTQTVTITATDSDGAVSTATFALTVDNVAPVLSDATFELPENSVNGTPVGTMTATDVGDDTIHYSIAGGTGATAFGIDPLSGVVTVVDQSQLDFETTQSFTLEIAATDEDGGTDLAVVLINLQNQATISGVVYVDTDQDGQFDADEMGVNDVVVELLNAAGDVLFSTVTQDGGLYFFEDMDAGTYRIRESQPSGVTDGPEQLGSIGGTVVADDLMELSVSDLDASDYNFAEFGQQLSSGDTAGIGFWQNKHGQALIEAGGTALAGWLTDNFGNIFGTEFVGASGADVASFYKYQLFKQKGKKSAGPAKVDAQFMAVAFAAFFTSQNLAGTVATGYGFNVSDTGIGTHVFNVGSSGVAFGVDDDTDLTIMQLLLATNQLTDVPDNYTGFASIYDQNGDGIIDSYEAFLRTLANDVFGAIND